MCQKEDSEEKCGGCAFLVGEDIYGYGSCAFKFADLKHCDDEACQNRIDRAKVRRSAAILKQYKRAVHEPLNVNKRPTGHDIDEAIDIVARYINVITKKV